MRQKKILRIRIKLEDSERILYLVNQNKFTLLNFPCEMGLKRYLVYNEKEYLKQFNHINKCGSSYLRHYFFQAAISLKRHNSYFKNLFIKKHVIEKKSSDEAHVYCAKKLCHITFKLLKSKTMFCPEKLVH